MLQMSDLGLTELSVLVDLVGCRLTMEVAAELSFAAIGANRR